MSEQNQRSDELFEQLSQNKKKRKRKIIRTVLIIIALVAAALVVTVLVLRRRVEERFAAAVADVKSHVVTTGTIHTLVDGSGTLAEVDLEDLTVPAGVEITDVHVEAGDTVQQGDLLATLDMSTVMTALSGLQEQLDELDDDINDAKGDTVSSSVKAGISGRVKRIFAQKGTDVAACMAENGALAMLSLDGYMAADIETDALSKGDSVKVLRADGSQINGKVKSAAGGKATVLVTDNGPKFDEEITVLAQDGSQIGKGKLYIHNSVAVVGYAGTVNRVNVSENSQVYSSTTVFTLKDTSFSANYNTLLRQRGELEETLMDLLTIYRDGAVLAPFDGAVSTVSYDTADTSTMTTDEKGNTNLLTLYPGRAMSITISVDETDILALEEGQEAEVVVSSVSEDAIMGTVTGISKIATTSSGVTFYSAEITVDKVAGMLAGMTAEVDVKIEGVENALIIPLDALRQTSAISYVYTEYDEETQRYGGMVEVTTGMQNDDYVEVLSGLKAGDTVYYTESQNSFAAMFGAMGGMGGMSGGMSGMGGMSGGMPSGGQMPGGNRSGMPSGGMPSGGQMPGGNRSGMNRGG